MHMKRRYSVYLFWILLTEAIGALSGFLSREGMKIYMSTVTKPPLSPPGWVFPVVWGILYALLGIGVTMVYRNPPSRQRSRGLNFYIAQMVVNFFWSLIFFNAQAFGFAFFWLLLLLVLVVGMVLSFRQVQPLAAKLQIPYLLWLVFAAYLNLGVWLLNA